MTKALQPSFYIPHGGGPCFFMDWTMGPPDTWQRMAQWLGAVTTSLATPPSAIVVISAHWEEPLVCVTSAAQPGLIYDYYGFPEHTYQLEYKAPGAPELASEIVDLLQQRAIDARLDPDRGFDHGTFIPLKVMLPNADVPVVQVSLHNSLDPQLHLDIGSALATLREQNILIIGSGMSYHNLPELMGGRDRIEESDQFDQWLTESCGMDAAARAERLTNWQAAPCARSVHPREEHLLPLMVAAGAGGMRAADRVFTDRVMGSSVSAFRFD